MRDYQAQGPTLRLLGRKGVFSAGTLGVLVGISVLISFLFELLVAKTPIPVYLLRVGLGTVLLSIALFFLGKVIDKNVSSELARTWINGSLAFLAGVARAYGMSYLELAVFGTALPANPFRPIIAGSAVYFAFCGIALVNGIRKDYLELSREFSELSSEIAQFQKAAGIRISDESRRLRRVAQKALLPQLIRLNESLSIFKAQQLTAELRALISDGIRPLSRKLGVRRELSIKFRKIEIPRQKAFAAIPSRFTFRESWYPRLSVALTAPTLLAVVLYVFGPSAVPQFLLVFISYAFIDEWMNRALPKKQYPVALVILVSMLQGAFMWATMLVVLGFLVNGQLVSYGVMVSVIAPAIFLRLILILMSFFSHNVRTNASLITNLLEEYRQLDAAVRNKLWVTRRNWSYLVHGSVQSSITLATARLAKAKGKPSQKLLALVRSDIDNARSSLELEPETKISLNNSIDSLKRTWLGVCSVKFSQSEESLSITGTASELNFGLNEIMKETVSNAFRHGNATEVDFQMSIPSQNVLRLSASDNGRPVSKNFVVGLGLQLFDELSIDWNIVPNSGGVGNTLTLDFATNF